MARQERAKPRPQGTGGDAPTDGSLQLIKSLLMLGQGTRFDQVLSRTRERSLAL